MKEYLWNPLFKKYGSFEGRACRKEYFSIVIFCFGSAYAISILLGLFAPVELVRQIAPKLPYIFSLIFGIPVISAGVRRLHDSNRSGWWFWIQVLPFIGFLWYVILMFLKGNSGPNNYGEDPLEPEQKIFHPADMKKVVEKKSFNPYSGY